MKIAHVITRMIIGGAQENTLFTVKGLKEYSEYKQVDLITGPTYGPEGCIFDGQGQKIGKDYKLIPELVRNINPVKDIIAFLKLYRLFKKEGYDIVHTHSSKAGILGRFAARLAGVKIIVHTIHGLPFHEYQSKIVNLFYVLLEKLAARVSTKIVTVCNVMTEKALKKNIGRKEQFVTIYSGMDLEPFLNASQKRKTMREKLGIKENEIVIGKIARLFYLKGHKFLFEAMKDVIKEYPNIRILLVGDGILKDSFVKKAQEMNIEKNIIFTGLVLPSEIPGYLSAMDFLVHVSLREGLARALPQAMASGLPVISFNIDGAKEVIENGENGYLIEPEDSEMLRDAILTMIKDSEFRASMGRYGKAKVDPIFRKEYMVRKIHELYMELE
ncbi:MAG: glycosyltransferase family 4 protein [Candidatus Aureabacteria bacterium]|nr:glycosyltransferase family 4 protein [Candidatus Auribacterota bacterium]